MDLDLADRRRERRTDLAVLAAALGTPEDVAKKLLAWAEEAPPVPKDEDTLVAEFLHNDRYFWRRRPMPAWVDAGSNGHA